MEDGQKDTIDELLNEGTNVLFALSVWLMENQPNNRQYCKLVERTGEPLKKGEQPDIQTAEAVLPLRGSKASRF